MVRSAQDYAATVGIAVTVAVVDEAGYPIAVGKMDGAEPRTVELAFHEAYTAAACHLPTAEMVPQARQPWLRSLSISHRGRIMPVGGGLPTIDGVVIVGGVGVAGASRPDHDILCCRAAIAVLESPGH